MIDMTPGDIRVKLAFMKNGKSRDVIIIGFSVRSYLEKEGWNVFPTVFSRSPRKKEITLDVCLSGDFTPLTASLPYGRTKARAESILENPAACYAASGAEFPDERLRKNPDWQPDGDWRKNIIRAAASLQPSRNRKG